MPSKDYTHLTRPYPHLKAAPALGKSSIKALQMGEERGVRVRNAAPWARVVLNLSSRGEEAGRSGGGNPCPPPKPRERCTPAMIVQLMSRGVGARGSSVPGDEKNRGGDLVAVSARGRPGMRKVKDRQSYKHYPTGDIVYLSVEPCMQ